MIVAIAFGAEKLMTRLDDDDEDDDGSDDLNPRDFMYIPVFNVPGVYKYSCIVVGHGDLAHPRPR